MDIVLFGPPGAGKGTQGELLAGRFQLRRLSTGDLLREAVRQGSALGCEARRYMDAGELVPDAVILGLVREDLEADTSAGVIFDGFPRTTAQAKALDELLAQLGRRLEGVLVLEVPDEPLIKRISGRCTCPVCGAVYNTHLDPPGVAGQCDRCGGALVQRADDDEATVRRRLSVYAEQTAPVLDYYDASLTCVAHVLGDRPVEEVQRDLVKLLSR